MLAFACHGLSDLVEIVTTQSRYGNVPTALNSILIAKTEPCR
jgi:hypothetical protein